MLNVTNFVAMDFAANALLALGASPMMSSSDEEMNDLAELAGAVVINMGTLNDDWLRCARAAFQAAKNKKKPIVFDPVGAGLLHCVLGSLEACAQRTNRTSCEESLSYFRDGVEKDRTEIHLFLRGNYPVQVRGLDFHPLSRPTYAKGQPP